MPRVKPENQVVAAEKGGLPPTTESVYDDPKLKKAFPFADLLRESIDAGRAAAGEPRLQRHLARHPEDVPPAGLAVDPRGAEQAQGPLDKAAEGKIF